MIAKYVPKKPWSWQTLKKHKLLKILFGEGANRIWLKLVWDTWDHPWAIPNLGFLWQFCSTHDGFKRTACTEVQVETIFFVFTLLNVTKIYKIFKRFFIKTCRYEIFKPTFKIFRLVFNKSFGILFKNIVSETFSENKFRVMLLFSNIRFFPALFIVQFNMRCMSFVIKIRR